MVDTEIITKSNDLPPTRLLCPLFSPSRFLFLLLLLSVSSSSSHCRVCVSCIEGVGESNVSE
ncbi:hypothetical protein Syun_030301 [Stephania yunnanensis]|uniref:Uncharacterized protein n=1 Tax=Stephania yunnanensis TaxID=152371 RepID=A0AAP0EAJ8_9MAGN